MPFKGFTDEDFEVFSLPDFDTRMPVLKERITPKLSELADELLPRLVEATGLELVPHVAQHLRRSVNPAGETWAAFSRSNRAYKPFVHLRVAINLYGIKAACFLEEDADDKPTMAKGLGANARAVGAYLKERPEIRSHDAEANYGKLLDGRTLTQKSVKELADRLSKVKSQHANFSIKFSRDDARVSTPGFEDVVLEALVALAPLYRLGAEPKYKLTS